MIRIVQKLFVFIARTFVYALLNAIKKHSIFGVEVKVMNETEKDETVDVKLDAEQPAEETPREKERYKVEVETPIGTMIFQVIIDKADVESAINDEVSWRMEKHGFSKWRVEKYTKRSLSIA